MIDVDLKHFCRATDPSRTLLIDEEEDRKLYIDFSTVRGGDTSDSPCSCLDFCLKKRLV